MHPIIFQIGPFALRYYGLMYALAALVGGWLLGKEVRRKGIRLSDDQRWNLVLLVLLGGILGGMPAIPFWGRPTLRPAPCVKPGRGHCPAV